MPKEKLEIWAEVVEIINNYLDEKHIKYKVVITYKESDKVMFIKNYFKTKNKKVAEEIARRINGEAVKDYLKKEIITCKMCEKEAGDIRKEAVKDYKERLEKEILGLVEVGTDPKTISTMLFVKNRILKLIQEG